MRGYCNPLLRILILLLMIPGSSVCSFNCSREFVHPLRIGTNVWPGYEPLFLAEHLGYLDRKDFHPVQLSSATDVLRKYRNGALEIAFLTLDETLLLVRDEIKPKIILVIDISNGGDVVLGGKGVKRLADLKGKRVGVESTALGPFVLKRALDHAGLRPSDIKIVRMTVDMSEKAFKEGQIDAVVTFEPFRTRLIEYGASILFDSSQIYGEIVDVAIVSDEILRQHPERIRLFIRQWYRTLIYMESNRKFAVEFMASREKITPQQYQIALRGLHFPGPTENHKLLYERPPALLKTVDHLNKYMTSNQLLIKEIDGRSLFPIFNGVMREPDL